MKKIFTHILNFFLILSILGSSSGLLINKMECLMTGNSIYSFEEFQCCEDSTQEKISTKCCDHLQLHLKMELQSLTKSENNFISYSYTATLIAQTITGFYKVPKVIVNHFDHPPPKSTLRFLTNLQVFRL